MTKVTAGTDGGGNYLNSSALESIGDGTATTHTSTKIVIGTGDNAFTLTGTGFADFNANGIPTEGTVTGSEASDGTKWSGFSISVSSVFTFFQNGDVTGLENALFSGNDEFVSRNTTTSQVTDDVFNGYAGNDVIDMLGAVAGAYAEVSGGDGNDTFEFGANFNAGTDKIDGGAGNDLLKLNGDYSDGLVFLATTMVNVEKIMFAAGHSYNLTANAATVATGTLTLDALNLGAGDALTFNGGAGIHGHFLFDAGAGNNTLTGGTGNDVFDLLSTQASSTAVLIGGAGNDAFEFAGNLNPATDRIDGGAATDVLKLNGDYSDGLVFQATTMVNVEKVMLSDGHSYNLTTNDATVAAGAGFTVDGFALTGANSLTFNGSAETNGHFLLEGGAGNDVLTGGAGNDKIEGGNGADLLNGGAGHNIFVYTSVQDSLGSPNDGPTGSGFDTITGFDPTLDKLDLWFKVTGIDAEVTSGQLRQVFFDDDMSAAINGAHLAVHHAVLFTPTSGDYDGKTFLIVEANGVAGYQSAGDLVIELGSPNHLTSLTTGTFI